MKEQDKTLVEKNPTKMEISNLPVKEFKAIAIEMLTELWKRTENAKRTSTKN